MPQRSPLSVWVACHWVSFAVMEKLVLMQPKKGCGIKIFTHSCSPDFSRPYYSGPTPLITAFTSLFFRHNVKFFCFTIILKIMLPQCRQPYSWDVCKLFFWSFFFFVRCGLPTKSNINFKLQRGSDILASTNACQEATFWCIETAQLVSPDRSLISVFISHHHHDNAKCNKIAPQGSTFIWMAPRRSRDVGFLNELTRQLVEFNWNQLRLLKEINISLVT